MIWMLGKFPKNYSIASSSTNFAYLQVLKLDKVDSKLSVAQSINTLTLYCIQFVDTIHTQRHRERIVDVRNKWYHWWWARASCRPADTCPVCTRRTDDVWPLWSSNARRMSTRDSTIHIAITLNQTCLLYQIAKWTNSGQMPWTHVAGRKSYSFHTRCSHSCGCITEIWYF